MNAYYPRSPPPQKCFVSRSQAKIKQNLLITVFSDSSVSMEVLLQGLGVPSGDSLPDDLQHASFLTVAMLWRTA